MASKKKTPTHYTLVARDTYTLGTPQGALTLRRGERLPARLVDGLPDADREAFEPLAPEAPADADGAEADEASGDTTD